MTENKTFAEAQNEKPFNWNEFLAKDKFTSDEINAAFWLAKNWTTCACGNQCAVIPRESDGRPKDRILAGFGIRFLYAIERMDHAFYKEKSLIESEIIQNRDSAKEILESIEKRSAELILEINGKQ
jgi:hypothetical protein